MNTEDFREAYVQPKARYDKVLCLMTFDKKDIIVKIPAKWPNHGGWYESVTIDNEELATALRKMGWTVEPPTD